MKKMICLYNRCLFLFRKFIFIKAIDREYGPLLSFPVTVLLDLNISRYYREFLKTGDFIELVAKDLTKPRKTWKDELSEDESDFLFKLEHGVTPQELKRIRQEVFNNDNRPT